MLASRFVRSGRLSPSFAFRLVSTLHGNEHIVSYSFSLFVSALTLFEYVFPDTRGSGQGYLLSLLSSEPVNPDLVIGSTTELPPTQTSFTENSKFLTLLQEVLAKHAFEDEEIKLQAQVMASTSGASSSSGGHFFPEQRRRTGRPTPASGDGAGGANSQGGIGSGGVGGWIHVSDSRSPPSYGRIPNPEDIFGSLQVDGRGAFVGECGSYQPSGTYRVITREGL